MCIRDRPYMQRHFDDVEVREWRGELVLPDVETLVAYWNGSGARWLLGGDAERVQPEIARLAGEWLARDGEMRVTSHGCAFIGTR